MGDETNLQHYANHVQCNVCRAWLQKEVAIPLASLSAQEQGLVRLEGFTTDHESYVCANCLETFRQGGGDINRYLNAFAHLESYHQIIQAIGRAFIGVVIVSNLFVTQNIVALMFAALVFALCDWKRLLQAGWTIIKFPPLLVAIVFTPWAITIFFGTRPFAFAKLVEDPFYYCPWKTFTLFHDVYIEAVFLGMFVLGILYIFAVFSAKYLDESEMAQ